jgi:ABC-2 type transport system ATP-binding protein
MRPTSLAGTPSRVPAILCAGLTKVYGKLTVLEGVDLAVHAGECFGLIGENGAGKTTLVKCVLDFCELDGGCVEIFGVPGRHVSSRAVLAYVPEGFTPPYHLTGEDFLRYMAHLHGYAHRRSEVLQVLERLELEPAALEQPARTYSKGMAQKLSLAAALLSGKSLFVLDEPTTGLDARAAALLRREIAQLKQSGKTVFLASHALADVELLCDRVAVMHAGRIRFTGTPAELRERHGCANLEAAFLACTGDFRQSA